MRATRGLLEQFFANAPAPIAMFDAEMRYIFASQRWLQGFGVEGQDLRGRVHYDVLPDLPERWKEAHRRGLAGEIVGADEDRFERPDGTVEWRRWEVRPWRNERGEIGGIFIFAEDITARKRYEADLRRKGEELQAILDAVPALVMYMDTGDKLLWVNRAYTEASGVPAEQIVGRSLREVLPDPNVDFYLAGNREVIESGVPKSFEAEMVETPYGQRWAETTKLPLRDAAGRISGVVVIVEDVTERKLAREQIERALADSSGRAAELQTVLDTMADGVFACDVNGRPTFANGAMLRLFGVEGLDELPQTEEMPVVLPFRFVDGRPVPLPAMPLARALGGESFVGEVYVVHNSRLGRDLFLRTNATPIRGATGEIVGAVVVSHDITELMELDRLKDQFVGVAAHELKTPVAIMKGYSQILLRGAATLSPPQRRMLDAIDRGANRIDRVVRDLLDVSRLRLGRLALAPERYDLAEQIAEIGQRFALAEPSHPIQPGTIEPCVVSADRDRIEHVVVNLLTNAARYSPASAEIRVELRAVGGEAVVSVIDRGVGIPKEKQGRIFEPFFRAHTDTPYDPGGMGMGLHISREIVERHGGRMWFESEEGKGSTFSFSLPLAGPNPPTPFPAGEGGAAGKG